MSDRQFGSVLSLSQVPVSLRPQSCWGPRVSWQVTPAYSLLCSPLLSWLPLLSAWASHIRHHLQFAWPSAFLWSCLPLTSPNHRLRIPALRSGISMLDYVSSNCRSFCFFEFISAVSHFSTSIVRTSRFFRQKVTAGTTTRNNRMAPRIMKWVLSFAGTRNGSGMTNSAVLFPSGLDLWRKVQ